MDRDSPDISLPIGPPGKEEAFILSSMKCVHWPSRHTLLVADLHLGHASTYHAFGVPLPAAQLGEELARLDACIARYQPERIVVLGDFLHAAAGLTPALRERVETWRPTFPGRVVVVLGNHDRALRSVATAWGLEVAGDRLEEGPFVLKHFAEPEPDRFVWCGHEHPATFIGGRADGIRLPCFALTPVMAILPAFSSMASGSRRGVPDGARLFAAAPGRIVVVPGIQRSASHA
jgi:DNA ligase-associated metallophosphoesterase